MEELYPGVVSGTVVCTTGADVGYTTPARPVTARSSSSFTGLAAVPIRSSSRSSRCSPRDTA